MAVFEPDRGRIVLRIVYDGPGRAGKTTNVEQLARIFGAQPGDELQVHPAATGRTIFFDWFSFDGGMLDGQQLQIQVVTVPGHKSLEPRRAHILHGADVVVLVCDSAVSGQDSAREMLDSLREHLGKRADHVPLLVQANKQDLPSAMSPPELAAALGLGPDVSVLGAQASAGIGVRETAIDAIRAAVRQMKLRTTHDGLGAVAGRAGTAEQLRTALQALDNHGTQRDDDAAHARPRAPSDEGRVVYIRSAKLVSQLGGEADAVGRARTRAPEPVPSSMSERPEPARPARPRIPVSAMFLEPVPDPPDIPAAPPAAVRVPPPPVLSLADPPGPAVAPLELDPSDSTALASDASSSDIFATSERITAPVPEDIQAPASSPSEPAPNVSAPADPAPSHAPVPEDSNAVAEAGPPGELPPAAPHAPGPKASTIPPPAGPSPQPVPQASQTRTPSPGRPPALKDSALARSAKDLRERLRVAPLTHETVPQDSPSITAAKHALAVPAARAAGSSPAASGPQDPRPTSARAASETPVQEDSSAPSSAASPQPTPGLEASTSQAVPKDSQDSAAGHAATASPSLASEPVAEDIASSSPVPEDSPAPASEHPPAANQNLASAPAPEDITPTPSVHEDSPGPSSVSEDRSSLPSSPVPEDITASSPVLEDNPNPASAPENQPPPSPKDITPSSPVLEDSPPATSAPETQPPPSLEDITAFSPVPEDSPPATSAPETPPPPSPEDIASSPPVPEDSPNPTSAPETQPPPSPEHIASSPPVPEDSPPPVPDPQPAPSLDLPPPRPDLPPGHVWPVPGGRHVLERIADASLHRASPSGHAPSSMLFETGDFRLHTRPEWRFADPEQGRAALRDHVRRAARLGPLLPADTAIALAPTGANDEHLLWHIVPALDSLGQAIERAPESERPQQLARLAAAYATALRLLARDGLALELAPHAFAEQHGRWVYLGARLGGPASATEVLDALLRPSLDLPSRTAWLDALEQSLPTTLTRDDVAALGLDPELATASDEPSTRLRAILARCS
ncbi:GTP-binding protein [Nannocystis bainbridge]|uniref:ADP-ribosylation factor-like protein n=1 Tax=Nannocystis bainbridge TaxID=2995303 RepID=A0ABT5ECX5_9BACT|nr:ADP-ribosylation factor-like protein [Nannocystis bainbridge]MDC0723727.1 ADP-ribosylation factor-like protein [Nannocystis bainbridge]